MRKNPEEQARGFPKLPGVYLMKDAAGKVIYVGKAKDLRVRVLSYFRKSGDKRFQVPYLMGKLATIDCLVTDTEKEALILENNLIKKHRPPYNIFFRDDKNFYSLRLDLSRPFPRPTFVRKAKNDGALYFGPYASSRAMKRALLFCQKLLPFRTCSDNIFRHRSRPCLYYQIGRCPAPCVGLISAEEYRETLDHLVLFLQGKEKKVLVALRRRMKKESASLEYEKAAATLASVRAIEETLEEQKITRAGRKDQDVCALVRRGEKVTIQTLTLRRGKMTGGRTVSFRRIVSDDRDALSSFLVQYYGEGGFVPDEIIIPFAPRGKPSLEEFLREQKGRKVALTVPRRGEKKKLLRMALNNLRIAAASAPEEEGEEEGLSRLRDRLGLKNLPRTVECFDISNLGGREAVGSMVVFRRGKKVTDDYRRYRVRTIQQADDCGMLFEVLHRRCERALKEGHRIDLIVVDGGKGQLNAALQVLDELGFDYPDVIALAKGKKGKGGKKIVDRVFLPGRKSALFLPPGSPELLFLMKVRDEAHRFAITYHKKLRRKKLGV